MSTKNTKPAAGTAGIEPKEIYLSANSIIKFPFHEDDLDVVRNDDGGISLSLRRMCENLGLDLKSQLRRLEGKPWAVVVMMTTTGFDGKRYEMACLSLRSVPMWLATIDTNRVRPQIRPKIERYQCECADALQLHFFGAPSAVADLRSRVSAMELKISEFERRIPSHDIDAPHAVPPPLRRISPRGKVIDGQKTCSRCQETKPLTSFAPSDRGAGGRYSQCNPCVASRMRQLRYDRMLSH